MEAAAAAAAVSILNWLSEPKKIEMKLFFNAWNVLGQRWKILLFQKMEWHNPQLSDLFKKVAEID